jgi:prevent-host-death family protein
MDPTPTVVGSNRFRDQLGYWMDRVAAGEEVILTRHGKPRIRLSPAQGCTDSDGRPETAAEISPGRRPPPGRSS